jgi:hypothetical protein
VETVKIVEGEKIVWDGGDLETYLFEKDRELELWDKWPIIFDLVWGMTLLHGCQREVRFCFLLPPPLCLLSVSEL